MSNAGKIFGVSEPELGLTDEMVFAKWEEVASLIDVLIQRIQDPADFAIAEGSELAFDDASSIPYQVSHCVRWGLNAGIEHLHAVKTLVIDARLIHASADYTLIRGAIENLAAAYWVLHPSDRNQRVIRALRWMAKNYKDQNTAITAHPGAGGAPWSETLLMTSDHSRILAMLLPAMILVQDLLRLLAERSAVS